MPEIKIMTTEHVAAANKAADEGRLAVLRQLSAEAAAVMDASRPVPTPEEIHNMKMNEDQPEHPEMPPLHEQHRRLAEATEVRDPLYRNRQMTTTRVPERRDPGPSPVNQTSDEIATPESPPAHRGSVKP